MKNTLKMTADEIRETLKLQADPRHRFQIFSENGTQGFYLEGCADFDNHLPGKIGAVWLKNHSRIAVLDLMDDR